jgi:hypothetical protein
MLCILKSIVAWAVLVLVGMNLTGLIVRGLVWAPPDAEAPNEPVAEILRDESRRLRVAKWVMTILSVLATAAYLVALFHFWNVWLAVAAFVLMATRLPDLVWELRTGARMTRQTVPHGPVYYTATGIMFGTLPLVWYSLCKT